MNKVILLGRLTKDPEIRYTQGDEPMCVARYTLAVDRRFRRQNDDQTADFIRCVAFGKGGEFTEKYLKKGMKICVSGRIQTGSYTNREGQKVYTTDVVIEEQDFAESKAAGQQSGQPDQTPPPAPTDEDGFMSIPDGIDDELPFK